MPVRVKRFIPTPVPQVSRSMYHMADYPKSTTTAPQIFRSVELNENNSISIQLFCRAEFTPGFSRF